MKEIVRRSDIFICDIPESENMLSGVHPVLILNCKQSLDGNLITIVPITSKIKVYPTVVRVGVESGLLKESIIICSQFRQIPKDCLKFKVGFVTAQKMDEVLTCINKYLGYKNLSLKVINKQKIEGMVKNINSLIKFKNLYKITDSEINDEINMNILELKFLCDSLNLKIEDWYNGEDL